MLRRAALIALLPAALAACGETNREVIARFKPQLDAAHAELKAMVATLPAPGSAVSGKLDEALPKPVYDVATGTFNTAILAVEDLDDVNPVFDLHLASDLGNSLAWSGPNNPMAESALDATVDGLDKEFETALATPIVIFYRAASYDPPRAVDEKTFDGGKVKLEAFVFARPGGKQVATCSIEAAADTNVSYSYKQGDDPMERLVAFANSSMWEDALKTLSECLTATTGGTFVFQRN